LVSGRETSPFRYRERGGERDIEELNGFGGGLSSVVSFGGSSFQKETKLDFLILKLKIRT